MFDFSSSFFKPMWRRVIIVLVCAGWGIFEWVTGAVFWAVLFCAMAAWSFWQFFLDRDNLRKLEDENNH